MTSTADAPARSGRAAALPPEERRAALVAVTLPLLLQHGSAVTTKQIAEAAGIAEGTIFRAFPDKDSLIDAVFDAAFDPAPLDDAIAAIDTDLPFDDRLVLAVEAIVRRATDLWRLLASVGPRTTKPATVTTLPALTAIFEGERERLHLEPEAAGRLFRSLILAGNHPAMAGDDPLPAHQLVALFLDGVRST